MFSRALCKPVDNQIVNDQNVQYDNQAVNKVSDQVTYVNDAEGSNQNSNGQSDFFSEVLGR